MVEEANHVARFLRSGRTVDGLPVPSALLTLPSWRRGVASWFRRPHHQRYGPGIRVVGGSSTDRRHPDGSFSFVSVAGMGPAELRRNRQQPLGGDCCSLRRHTPDSMAKTGNGKSYLQVNPATRGAGTRYYLDKVIVHSGYRKNARLQNQRRRATQDEGVDGWCEARTQFRQVGPGIGHPEQVYGFGERVDGDRDSQAAELQEGRVGGPRWSVEHLR